MTTPENVRRELLKALYSTERLAHLYKKTSYYSEQPIRKFIDQMWNMVETGHHPDDKSTSDTHSYLNSENIPEEEDCDGEDLAGLPFISAVSLLISYLKTNDPSHLMHIRSGIEASSIDELVIEDLSKDTDKSVVLITEEISKKAELHPLTKRFREQLNVDNRKAGTIDLTSNEIISSKTGSTDDITTFT